MGQCCDLDYYFSSGLQERNSSMTVKIKRNEDINKCDEWTKGNKRSLCQGQHLDVIKLLIFFASSVVEFLLFCFVFFDQRIKLKGLLEYCNTKQLTSITRLYSHSPFSQLFLLAAFFSPFQRSNQLRII